MSEADIKYMELALQEAVKAGAADEVPVGAVVVSPEGEVLSMACNTGEHGENAMAHAEIKALAHAAAALEQSRLWECTLYVTLEPCTMCAAAVSMMRIKRLVFGAENKKGGAVVNGVRFYEQPTCNHRPVVECGVMAEECGTLLTAFFKNKR